MPRGLVGPCLYSRRFLAASLNSSYLHVSLTFQRRLLTLDIKKTAEVYTSSTGRNLAQSLAGVEASSSRQYKVRLVESATDENMYVKDHQLHLSCDHALRTPFYAMYTLPTDFLSSRKLHVPRLAGKKGRSRVVQLLNASTALLLRYSELAFSKKYEVPLLTVLAK